LAPLGLRYRKHGSGARIYLAGSDEFTKASAFGQAYSIIKLQKKFGPYEDAEAAPSNEQEPVRTEIASITGTVPGDDRKATASSSFKLTLLRRVYTGLHLDDEVSKQIRYVNLDGKPPSITFRDDSTVEDHGGRISTTTVTNTTIKASVAMAKAKGWRTVVPSGSPEFVRGIAIEAARSGLAVSGVPNEIQTLADEILEQERKKAGRLAQEADVALMNHLSASADREAAISDNMSHAAAVAADAIFGEDRQKSAEGEPRGPGRPPVQDPQPAPDAEQHDRTGKRQIERQLRDNDVDELDNMKRVDIGVIAAMGGWSDVSRAHPDSSDPHGKTYRIYTRGTDTVKCSQTDGMWLWTSNKSGRSGSVVDLWLHDNPGKTLGHARAAFRELLGSAVFTPVTETAHRTAKQHDHTEARRRWLQAPHIDPSVRTYAEDRGISRDTLARFGNAVRAGAFGGIYFAHRDIDTGDIQGFEQRWERNGQKNAARFAKGGRKSVNVLGDPETATRMAVLESGLDALALAELEMRSDTIYISTGGGFGPITEAALHRLADGKEVVAAFDNDAAGEAMHRKMLAFLPSVGRHAPPVHVDGTDMGCNDWLDVLNAGLKLRSGTHMQEEPENSEDRDPQFPTDDPAEEISSNAM